VLANGGYTQAQAAAALGISRVTLYSKIKKYGLTWRPSQAAATEVHPRKARASGPAGASLFSAPGPISFASSQHSALGA
jgi:hypothetical protein